MSTQASDYQADDQLANLAGCAVRHGTIPAGGLNLHFVETGQGRPLLLIHGLNIGWGQWYRNLAGLAKRFRVIAVDLPGCGASPGPEYRALAPADYRRAIAALADQLALTDMTVVGHSFGSTLALGLALDRPGRVSRVIVAGPLALSQAMPPAHRPITIYPLAWVVSHTVMRPTRTNLHRFLAGAVDQANPLPDALLDYYANRLHRHPRRHPFMFMSSLSRHGRYRSGVALPPTELAAVAVPVLVVAGRRDRITPPSGLAPAMAHLPRGRLTIVRGCGHVPNLELPGQFNQLIEQFVTQKAA